MTPQDRINRIVQWLKEYTAQTQMSTFVVGISGGIDSSVVSSLCALTGIKTIVVQLPIRQKSELDRRSCLQAQWLQQHFPGVVEYINIDLSDVFTEFESELQAYGQQPADLAFANSRSRLRMMTLYQIAQSHRGLVVGTGNRIEDFGVGFFTKYGDGGVDISPIGDCLKTQVWDMGRALGLPWEIIEAAPTDGLWDDGRSDEDQLGMSYQALELAMAYDTQGIEPSDPVEIKQLARYRALRAQSLHKMQPIPVCEFGKN